MRKDFEFENYLICLPSHVSRERTVCGTSAHGVSHSSVITASVGEGDLLSICY